MQVLIYSANVGSYDNPQTHVQQTIPCDTKVFTEPIAGLDNTRSARWYKTHPPEGYDYTIWVDSCLKIKSPHFAQLCVDAAADKWATFSHVERDCFYEEAKICRYMKKCLDQPVWEQAEHYLSEGMPKKYGLWATGVLARSNWGADLNNAWWTEINKWSTRDQISLPYVLWKSGKEINKFPFVWPTTMLKLDYSTHLDGYKQCPQ